MSTPSLLRVGLTIPNRGNVWAGHGDGVTACIGVALAVVSAHGSKIGQGHFRPHAVHQEIHRGPYAG
ncbi:hypothetical protein [uncultured Cutibacterium sp.]|uniref:hypothetical protein n=1 Tax=uncultured Cutibacterium sp. TaxID=1912223 RepID=UPI0025979CFE|nr:hypothetical protein [uncultured Cutibacterium sp.]